ncbi:MAG: hypothetical protein GY814_10125, partial [Gammaproteobacteria bacterium]|nr:hypothetical protein [Gammaproteobacteria bacterium]
MNQAATSLGFALPTYEVIQAIISDFSDGNVDGTINGTPVSVTNGVLPSDLDLDTAITRFKNNNFANFQTTSLLVINYDLLNNILPTANAGTDQTVAQGASVSLSGSASDSDGAVVSISWTQTQGTAVTLDNSNTLNPSFQTPSISDDETAIFELTVTDDIGEFSTDSVSINIVANNNPVVTAATFTVDENSANGTAVGT